jgi:hypothetical protein
MSHNRHYISPDITAGAFLKSLQAKGLSHAVLRWFENLPHVELGEDIDILVADEDAPALLAMLEKHGPGQAVDLYSASGKHGLGWRGTPYLPPRMAKQLLDRRIHGKACDHPAPDEHLASLAFHVVYHKGTLDSPDHDYRRALGLAEDITLQELARQLRHMGWQPSLKALWRWRRHNRFISGHLPGWLPAKLRGA